MILDPRPSFQAAWLNQKCCYLKNRGAGWIKSEILIQNVFRAFLANWIKLIRANLPHVHSFFWEFQTEAISISHLVLKLEILDPQTPGMWIPKMFCRFPIIPLYLIFLFFLGNWDQATLKSPGFESGNLDRPKLGMLVPNMFCTFVQIPHHDLVPFSALQINGLFLWSVGINLYIPQEGSYNQTFKVLTW